MAVKVAHLLHIELDAVPGNHGFDDKRFTIDETTATGSESLHDRAKLLVVVGAKRTAGALLFEFRELRAKECSWILVQLASPIVFELQLLVR